jgi:tol-pal system protein YbgF
MKPSLKKSDNRVPMGTSFIRGFCSILVSFIILVLTGCTHTDTAPPPSAVDAPSEISEETLRTFIVRLNKRYENVDGRIAHNQESIQALEEELISLRQAVGVTGVKEDTTRQADKTVSVKPVPLTRSSSDPKKLYDAALTAYYRRNYPTAISRFQEFITAFPSSDLADNALYWIGESYYAKEDFERAISSFLKVADRYPNGSKVPDALFKIGLSYGRLNDREKATEYLTRVMDNYPFSSAAQQAKTRLGQYD